MEYNIGRVCTSAQLNISIRTLFESIETMIGAIDLPQWTLGVMDINGVMHRTLR